MSNATVDALGMCFSHIPLLVWLIASSDKSYIRMGKVYTYRRGLRRCSFNNPGQCEGLNQWDE